MKTFYRLLVNTLLANMTNNFLWFALIFWTYIETGSIMATSIIGGTFMLCSAISGLFFGTFVDHHKKKTAMVYSSVFTLACFLAAAALYTVSSHEQLLAIGSFHFWAFVLLILAGAVAGNLRNIALSTTVTLLVPEKRRDKANGMVGTAMGLSFTLTSVFSGLAIGRLGMGWTLALALMVTAGILLHMLSIKIKESKPVAVPGQKTGNGMDVRGALLAISKVPGLMPLIFFATFNNFLGGVFMSLMDPYGLTLVSVEAWGIMWGIVSCGFILGGILVAAKGLGKSPLRTLFVVNIIMWIVCILFPVKSAILPLAIGMLIYMALMPVVEAAEQTIIQRVVPFESQGRVFGFGQSVEMAASPITAFLIGPIAQIWVIPYMTTGQGAESFGSWFGTGPERGMALIFIAAGIIGLVVTLLAMRSKGYARLSRSYDKAAV